MNKKLISLLGGTGDLGTGLATRLLKAGYKVIIGSRTLEKAQHAERSLGKNTKGLLNKDAALQGEIIILTVPFAHQREGSAAEIAQNILGDDVRVVSAFQNISAELLQSDKEIDCDVLVCGNKKEWRQEVIDLVNTLGMKGWHAGMLPNSAAVEAMTSVLISINKHHEISHSGIKVTGLKK